MKVIEFDVNNVPSFSSPITLCLGYFDGVHLGHQSLIKKAIKVGYQTAVLSFDNSPAYILGKVKENQVLTTKKEKIDLLNKLGVKYFLILKFNSQLANLSKESFIDLLKRIKPKTIVCGPDYTFGKDKTGTIDDLKNEFDLICANFKKTNNSKISSKEIINLIEQGDVSSVKPLLGRFYSIEGKVEKGLQNGRTINFPTANINNISDKFTPQRGVYACYCYINNHKYKSIVNVGSHPTIDELDSPIIEAHILNFNKNIYKKNLKVEFVKRLRDEIKFSSLDDLKVQLEKDKKEVINLL